MTHGLILFAHGARDPLVSVAEVTRFHAAHRARDAAVELRILPELGHGVSPDAVEIAREFVAAALGVGSKR